MQILNMYGALRYTLICTMVLYLLFFCLFFSTFQYSHYELMSLDGKSVQRSMSPTLKFLVHSQPRLLHSSFRRADQFNQFDQFVSCRSLSHGKRLAKEQARPSFCSDCTKRI